jgi:hypothetical protein
VFFFIASATTFFVIRCIGQLSSCFWQDSAVTQKVRAWHRMLLVAITLQLDQKLIMMAMLSINA